MNQCGLMRCRINRHAYIIEVANSGIGAGSWGIYRGASGRRQVKLIERPGVDTGATRSRAD